MPCGYEEHLTLSCRLKKKTAAFSAPEYFVVSLFSQRQAWAGCSGSGDYVELLGGNGVDTSMMVPMADLCFSLTGLGESEPLLFSSELDFYDAL